MIFNISNCCWVSKVSPYLLWSIDDSRIVTELKHS